MRDWKKEMEEAHTHKADRCDGERLVIEMIQRTIEMDDKHPEGVRITDDMAIEMWAIWQSIGRFVSARIESSLKYGFDVLSDQRELERN